MSWCASHLLSFVDLKLRAPSAPRRPYASHFLSGRGATTESKNQWSPSNVAPRHAVFALPACGLKQGRAYRGDDGGLGERQRRGSYPPSPTGWYLFSLLWARSRSADFQSAVSPNCIRQGVAWSHASEFPNAPQSATLRYGRVQLCATIQSSLREAEGAVRWRAKSEMRCGKLLLSGSRIEGGRFHLRNCDNLIQTVETNRKRWL